MEGSTEILHTAVAATGTGKDVTKPPEISKTAAEKERKSKARAGVKAEHIDIIKDEFWQMRPWILSGKPGKLTRLTTI
jgi:tRNA(His) guanylyltransferase